VKNQPSSDLKRKSFLCEINVELFNPLKCGKKEFLSAII
jgi:hypothetical protein